MGRYNLLDENWISVIVDDYGNSKKVSLIDALKNAHLYKDIAGDTKTQDFAVLRLMLSILHTVFSRYDYNGEKYSFIEFDDKNRQKKIVGESYSQDYSDLLYDSWINILESNELPSIVEEYLEFWREKFYLFDEKYPFYQVRRSDIAAEKLNKDRASEIAGKNINRKISESANKIALFSPKFSKQGNKEILSGDQIARWLITLQGYIGLSDKVIFGNDKYKASKGWLFDIGGIYLKGNTLFETLLLNLVLVCEDNAGELGNIQRPCWEIEIEELISGYFNKNINNIAELYTSWSRAIYIDPEIDINKGFSCSIVKLPEFEHCDNFLEQMTIWKFNENGDNKGKFTPKKHNQNQSLWRSFGLVNIESHKANQEKVVIPGVVSWFKTIKHEYADVLKDKIITISAVSMQDDGNATSWVPTDEIIDDLLINEFVFADTSQNGWVARINEVVEFTKKIIEHNYKFYIRDIKEVRNINTDSFVSQKIEDIYFEIDKHFREWLYSLKKSDSMDDSVFNWKMKLYKFVMDKASKDIESSTIRDFTGVITDKGVKNIASAYNKFLYFLNIDFSEVLRWKKK